MDKSKAAEGVDASERESSAFHAALSGEGQEFVGREQDDEAKEAAKAQQKQKIAELMNAAKNKGVVYMSRIPPHLKPLKLRHLLSQHGELGRLYLAPEDPGIRKKRKKLKGSTGKEFTEGWVEFKDKRVAKRVAEMLNGNPMGGKRRSAHHDDLWNLKYLPKFKWDHLTEEIAYQNAVREQKLANEISAAKRERDFYLSRVDKAKAKHAMDEKRQKKAAQNDQFVLSKAPGEPDRNAEASEKKYVQQGRHYGQRKAKLDPTDDADAPQMSRDVLSLLAGVRQ